MVILNMVHQLGGGDTTIAHWTLGLVDGHGHDVRAAATAHHGRSRRHFCNNTMRYINKQIKIRLPADEMKKQLTSSDDVWRTAGDGHDAMNFLLVLAQQVAGLQLQHAHVTSESINK